MVKCDWSWEEWLVLYILSPERERWEGDEMKMLKLNC